MVRRHGSQSDIDNLPTEKSKFNSGNSRSGFKWKRHLKNNNVVPCVGARQDGARQGGAWQGGTRQGSARQDSVDSFAQQFSPDEMTERMQERDRQIQEQVRQETEDIAASNVFPLLLIDHFPSVYPLQI